jgi:hypothetical protein
MTADANPTTTLTDEQLDTLRHMLGINDPSQRAPVPYRNHYAANPGDPKLVELERLGMVELCRRAGGAFEYDFYRCTDAGQTAARRSHRTIRHPKARRVYHRFLEISDAYSDLTFKEFLTLPRFAQARREA